MEDSASPITERGALLCGFLLVSVGILIARIAPATGYEGSIMHSTPVATWIALGSGALLGAVLVLHGSGRTVGLGAALSGLSVMTVVLLPVIRGYNYLGEYDSLTHVGWTRDIAAGVIDPVDSMYPGLHLSSIVLTEVIGYETSDGMVLFTLLVPVVLLLFVPLTVRNLDITGNAYRFGIVSALLLLPINVVRLPVLQPIPMTVSVFFLPFCIYAYVRVKKRMETGFQILLLIGCLSVTLFHPQQAFVLLVVFLTVAIYERYVLTERGDQMRSTYGFGVSALLGLLFIVWMSRQFAFLNQIIRMVAFLLNPDVGQDIGGATDAAAGTGSNFVVLVTKSLSVSIVFAGITAATVFLFLLAEVGISLAGMHFWRRRMARVLILAAGSVGTLVGVFVLAGVSNQYFRFFGSLMVFASILVPLVVGTIAVGRGTSRYVSKRDVLNVVLILSLLLSVTVVHPSMYISKPTGHITDAQERGYEHAFETGADDVQFVPIYSPVDRYREAIYGRTSSRAGVGILPAAQVIDQREERPAVPPHFADRNLSSVFDGPKYLVVTASDEYRTIEAHNESQFTREDYEWVASDEQTMKVYDGDDFEWYYGRY